MERTLKYIRKRFERLKKKRILIYGAGSVTERLIDALEGFEIVGIIDRTLFEGKVKHVPVMIWDDIDNGSVDVIIIAALKKNYKIIFDRIQYYCRALSIIIYGENGQNLTEEYQFKYIHPLHGRYFQKNIFELKKLIDQYDAISFELFDTLVMRRTMESEDVFDLVEREIRKKGIVISDFKKKRHTAQVQTRSNNIYTIYDHLKKREGISDSESMLILQEEIECEKKCLVSRKVMVDLMNYAVKKGKRISIIEDTYFPVSVIEEFLFDLNIIGYDKLYLSSEYGVGKSNGIFEIYSKDINDVKCIHIGDEKNADMIAARCNRLDFYGIKSAYELLKISNLRKLLLCSCGVDNRIALGFMIAVIFNSPFALHNSSGVVKIKTLEEFSIFAIVPLILIYMQNLFETIKEKNVDMILFASRDGYLFKKIYDYVFFKSIKIPSIYFLTSRKLCLKASMGVKEDILDLCNIFSTEGELKFFLEEVLKKDLLIEIGKPPQNIRKVLSMYSTILEQYSNIMRENYLAYIKKVGINREHKYLFCELNSTGTIHEALNKILEMDLEGFYLYKRTGVKERKLKITSVYDNTQGANIDQLRDLLEIVFTSKAPSICGMSDKGEALYSFEYRSEKELYMLERLHNIILNNIQLYVELSGTNITVSKKLSDIALGLLEYIKFEEEAKIFVCQKNLDDMTQKHISIFDKVGLN